MDNYHAELLIESNKRMMVALGMHWENVKLTAEGHPVAYGEGHFHNLACEPFN